MRREEEEVECMGWAGSNEIEKRVQQMNARFSSRSVLDSIDKTHHDHIIIMKGDTRTTIGKNHQEMKGE